MNKEELAKFFTEQPDWRWVPGIRWTAEAYGTEGRIEDDEDAATWNSLPEGELPDITDPATIGGIVQVVAEAHGCTLNDVSVVRTTGGVWSVWIHTSDTASHRVAAYLPSRVEALAMALQNGGKKNE